MKHIPNTGNVIALTAGLVSAVSWNIAGSIALLAGGGSNALAQSSALTPGFLEHPAVTPPPLFREVRQQPPHTDRLMTRIAASRSRP